MIDFKVSQDFVAALALPLLAHGDGFFFGRRDGSAGGASLSEHVVKVGQLFGHPCGQEDAAGRRLYEELPADTAHDDAGRVRVHGDAAETVVVDV